MTMSKEERDRAHNAGIEDLYIHTEAMPWLDFSPGFQFKVLRTSAETGTWAVMFKADAGTAFPRHNHLGAGEYLMISGKMEVRGGVQEGGITALPGDYGYEPNGIIHDRTEFPVESVFWFQNHGAVNFTDDENRTLMILDWQTIRQMEAAGTAKLAQAA